ncbi:MAG: glucans biosynthesis glucosyltransferase MdoH [Deltaproteobacteria bacterium]|nr:glucans biosynthesis glucosyltransferase MdoH [Deltaproteobacteria bacterium]
MGGNRREKRPREPWARAAILRRLVILILILVTCVFAGSHMAEVLPQRGGTGLEKAIILVFGALFSWISIGFWEAVAGAWTLIRRYDRFAITREGEDSAAPLDPGARTAILLPMSNEDVDRVFSGLRAVYRSLEETGRMELFDFFVLSDSSDPDTWVREEIAWADMCRSMGVYGRVFYRRRRVNIKRKSGNIADFCRRWGQDYRYMIVLDADSVMAGSTLVRMVRLMESHPRTGILQTAPMAVNRETLFGRVQQFANHAYGPLFIAGLHFLQLGDSHFWGHNAIIRIAPFIRHCALPQLPGRPPRGGLILSHDFVEAALIRRGGWEVWLAYDLKGSYEEVPPTLLEELKRDRRWCQGNLQHMRLLFARGLLSAHRALFLHGAMSYVSSLLWVLFLALSSAEALLEAFRTPVYFPHDRVLFPSWPVWYPQWAMVLLSMTGILLLLPKILSVFLILAKRGRARLFGSAGRLIASMLAEVLFSALFAPIRMLFHSKYVFTILLGRQVGWTSQRRSDQGTGWGEAVRFHAGGMILAFLWGVLLFVFNRPFFWWNVPVLAPLLLSVPLSVWSARAGAGRALRRRGIFITPEESEPVPELRFLEQALEKGGARQGPFSIPGTKGFVLAVVDPNVNVLHRVLLGKRRRTSPSIAERRRRLRDRALSLGPGALSAREKKELLGDPQGLLELHRRVWEITDPGLARTWGLTA